MSFIAIGNYHVLYHNQQPMYLSQEWCSGCLYQLIETSVNNYAVHFMSKFFSKHSFMLHLPPCLNFKCMTVWDKQISPKCLHFQNINSLAQQEETANTFRTSQTATIYSSSFQFRIQLLMLHKGIPDTVWCYWYIKRSYMNVTVTFFVMHDGKGKHLSQVTWLSIILHNHVYPWTSISFHRSPAMPSMMDKKGKQYMS